MNHDGHRTEYGFAQTRRATRRARSSLYRGARLLGDVEAAAKGPRALAHRQARKVTTRKTLGLLRRLLG